MTDGQASKLSSTLLAKVPTGITGLDEITNGGFPANRPTLVCGGPGCGKTVLAMEFLVRGAKEFGEPGLFFSFEESEQNLIENFKSFGFEIKTLLEQKKLKIVHLNIQRGEIIEAGDFSLDGLLIRLESGIKEIGAKRITLDTIESIFSAMDRVDILRREIDRLFKWLRDKGFTTVITGERGNETFTRHGFEEYVSDCVILLDHRIVGQISKRRLRIIKYRGSSHGKDEYPFLIGSRGVSVFPITSLRLEHRVDTKRISTGVINLDQLLEGEGYFQGSNILVSGKAGTGKSTLAAAFASAACARGERCLYLAFEESAGQLVRNMGSVGIDLGQGTKNGKLIIQAHRPTYCGLEEHLVAILEAIDKHKPQCIVIDPITNFISVGKQVEVKAMLLRVMDYIKDHGITLFFTALTGGSGLSDETDAHVSSKIDTWITLDLNLVNFTRRRDLRIVKSRGMKHSLITHELVFSSNGLSLRNLEEMRKP